jgi:hypothetical protein
MLFDQLDILLSDLSDDHCFLEGTRLEDNSM